MTVPLLRGAGFIFTHPFNPLSGGRAVKFFIPLLRGDKGVCSEKEQTHPCPSQEGICPEKVGELNSPASQEGKWSILIQHQSICTAV